jgi:phage/plasmid-like protein (TIGR03299 family)
MSTYTLPELPSPAAVDILEKSRETMLWLRENIRVGYTTERGPAWWAAGAVTKDGTWDTIPDGSHFAGPVPYEEVRRLLDIPLVKATAVYAEYLDENGQRQVARDESVLPVINARTGRIFSYPKEGYRIHPYLVTLHGFIQEILDDPDVGVGSVGLLKQGGVAFLQARLPESFEVAGYGYQPYITAVTSADLSRSSTWLTGALGAVCDNTVNSAILGALTSLKVRHTRNSDLQVQKAREKLGIQLVQVAEDIGSAIESLVKVDVSDAEFRQWLDLTAPLPERKETKSGSGGRGYTLAENEREEKIRLWTKDEKVAPWTGTGFGIFQLDNTYRTWEGIVRKASRLERNFSNDALGLTAKADLEALDALARVKGGELVLA